MVSMASFTDELVKIALSPFLLLRRAMPLAKPTALLGTGALTYHLGEKELDKYRLGRQVYEQMQARQAE